MQAMLMAHVSHTSFVFNETDRLYSVVALSYLNYVRGT